jgi:hypothetical protein
MRLNELERAVMGAVAISVLPSTNEVRRVVNRCGTNAGRAAVTRTLNGLETKGCVKNIGDGADAWMTLKENT